MAAISSWALVSSIQSEIQREQNDLKYVDENLKRLTGRDFNEPSRGDRRIRVVSGTREEEPQPKPRYPKGVFARLGAPVLDGTIKPRAPRRVREVSEDNGEPPKKKPLIASSVARPTFDGKTRTEAAAELTKDRASRDRNRRMFGSLLGTLQRFKTEEAKLKDKDDKRAKVEQKLEEKGRAEKELLRQERIDLINQRKERQARIHRLNIKMARVKEHEAWEKYQRQLQKFIRTKSTPKIFWFPKISNARCLHLISATKDNIEKELEDERLELKKELEELLGERFNRDEMDDEIDEEYSEGLRREQNESYGGGLGESHFSNGSSLNNFETEEGELINEAGELWLSGKKGQNPERFVIQVDSMNEAPMRRVEIVTVAAPHARRVKEERVDKNKRVKERIQMENEMENLTNGRQKENEKGKEKMKGKERKKLEKARNKEREKLRSIVKDSSQQRIVLERTEIDILNIDDENSSPEKQNDSPMHKETAKADSEKRTKKNKTKTDTKENNELVKNRSQRDGKGKDDATVEIIEENIICQKSKSENEIEKNRSSKRDKQMQPTSDGKDAGDKEMGLLSSEGEDSNETTGKSQDASQKGKRSSLIEGGDFPLHERQQSLRDSKDIPEKDRRLQPKEIIEIPAKDQRQPAKDSQDVVGREGRLSQKEGSDCFEKEKRHSHRARKDISDKEKKESEKDGKEFIEREKKLSQKDGRITVEKDKRQSQREGKDIHAPEKGRRHSGNDKEKRQSQRDLKDSSKVSKANKEDHGRTKSQRGDKGKNRKTKTVDESTENDDLEGEEIWSEDLSHISLPLEPEPAVTEVVVQRVPISEDGQDDEDDHSEMQVESVLIPVSQIKKDKTVWEPLPFHWPIIIKKEKDPSPVLEKRFEKDVERKKRESESSSDSSDSEESSSDSEESSEEEHSSSNSSDSSSASNDERIEKKKVTESKGKRLEMKEGRIAKEKGRRNTKKKGGGSSSSSSSESEDESSSSSSSESEDSSSDDEKIDKKVKEKKKASSKVSHKGRTSASKDSSLRDKDRERKGGKVMPLDKMEDLKKKMDEEADRLRQRIIRGVGRRSKSRERVRSERQSSRSRERQRERSRERKKTRK